MNKCGNYGHEKLNLGPIYHLTIGPIRCIRFRWVAWLFFFSGGGGGGGFYSKCEDQRNILAQNWVLRFLICIRVILLLKNVKKKSQGLSDIFRFYYKLLNSIDILLIDGRRHYCVNLT